MYRQAQTTVNGFTLLEAIVVIAFVSLLATFAFGKIDEGRKKARDTQRVSDIAQLQLALRIYKDAEGNYPENHNSGTVIGEGGALDDVLSPYLTNTIRDLSGSSDDETYEYVYDSSVTCSGVSRKVLYAKTMEREERANWSEICGGTSSPGKNTYVVILP